jgi:acyl-CoA reductase-like NAD-dependent aldehyde dehydrogenase
VWINDWHAVTVDSPFGGYKQSGYGKELAIESIEYYLQSKSILASFERKPEFKAMHSMILR